MSKWARACSGSLGGKLCHRSAVLEMLPVNGLHKVSLIRLGLGGMVALGMVVAREPSLDWAMASLIRSRRGRLPLLLLLKLWVLLTLMLRLMLRLLLWVMYSWLLVAYRL